MIDWFLSLFGGCKHKWITYSRRDCNCIHTGIHLWVDIYQSCSECGKERHKKI